MAGPVALNALVVLDVLSRNWGCIADRYGLTHFDQQILLYVLSRGGLEGACFASNERMSREMDRALRELQRHVSRLAGERWLTTEQIGRRRHLRFGKAAVALFTEAAAQPDHLLQTTNGAGNHGSKHHPKGGSQTPPITHGARHHQKDPLREGSKIEGSTCSPPTPSRGGEVRPRDSRILGIVEAFNEGRRHMRMEPTPSPTGRRATGKRDRLVKDALGQWSEEQIHRALWVMSRYPNYVWPDKFGLPPNYVLEVVLRPQVVQRALDIGSTKPVPVMAAG